jgi:hypothetical protein
LRASFLQYLAATYGKDSLLRLAYSERPFSEEVFATFFGPSFAELTAAWKPWALARFEALPRHEEMLQEYLKKTAIQYFPVCKRGSEF